MSKPKKYIYHIIITSCGKQIKDIYHSAKEESVYKRFNELLRVNKSEVVFPVRYINNNGLKDANYKLMIIKTRGKNESSETRLRDDYGKFANYTTSNDDWVVIEMANYYREETFWVYGFHPQLQRKTFNWIFDNFIIKDCNKYLIKNVYVFKNKFIVECNGELHIVMCKNIDDAIRLFNQLEETYHKKKGKYVLWSGNMTRSSLKKDIIKIIMDFTGWNYNKVRRNSLRP